MKYTRPPMAAARAALTLTLLYGGVNLHAQQNPPPVPAATPANVPISEVVLFSSGVGYFQHDGTVEGDATTQLRFKTGQINDVLKSLVLQDLGGGKVGVVTYPSQEPLDKTLGSFQVNLSEDPSIGELLDKLRGARLSLTYLGPGGVETFSASVLGVEERDSPSGKEDGTFKKEFLNVVAEHGIRSLDLEKVSQFQLEDAGLQDELHRALLAVAAARDQDKKPVDIRFNGRGERHVRLGYVVETPVWKASYRLVLNGEKLTERKPPAFLQGWAIVENETDNDWNKVRLSLISGRPISFTEDLYQSLYVPRPEVTPERYASLRPQTYAGGETAKGDIVRETKTRSLGGAAIADNPVRVQGEAASAPAPAMASLSATVETVDQAARESTGEENRINPTAGVKAISDTANLGELFEYTVNNVSLPRQRSAMIPIINDPVEVEKLSIYNESVLGNHPLNGARLKNTTADAKHLLGGPITVFDDGHYAGDAQIDDVPPGQTRLISYGIDLGVLAVTKELSDQQRVTAGKIVKGVLELTQKRVSAKQYDFEDNSDYE